MREGDGQAGTMSLSRACALVEAETRQEPRSSVLVQEGRLSHPQS
jgi:hypothetical protein